MIKLIRGSLSALPRRQREEHRRGESTRPPHSPGWQEGEEQGGGLRAGDRRRPPASHPGDLGRRGGRRRAAARPQRGEEQEHEGRAGRRHPAHPHPGLIDRSRPDDLQSRRCLSILRH
uniref:Uncharacterized protein n=1 Tax=Aegilops tauschii subsp. strangulata TaxID=200361 RepID=A0A453H5A2_AEGTS